MTKRENETQTGFALRLIRAEIINECANLAQKWADEAAEFKDNERCAIQANVCRAMSLALRNLADPIG